MRTRRPLQSRLFLAAGDAFTTIEILLVVIILGITAAVAIPRVGNRADVRLAAATRKLVADLQYAQNLAIASRESIYVRFDTNVYTLCKKSGSSLVTLAHPVEKSNFIVQFGSAPSSSALASVTLAKPSFGGHDVLGFDSLGGPFAYSEIAGTKTSLAAQATLTLGSGGYSQLIKVEPYTGEISVP